MRRTRRSGRRPWEEGTEQSGEGRGGTRAGRQGTQCHLSHEDVREGRSPAHRRFWKLRGRRFEWAWALPGAATPLSRQKGSPEQTKPRTPGHPRPVWERATAGKEEQSEARGWKPPELRQEGSQDAKRGGEREVSGADPTHGSDVLRKSHHRQPLCWEGAAGRAVVPAPRPRRVPSGEPGPRMGRGGTVSG